VSRSDVARCTDEREICHYASAFSESFLSLSCL
jgi:hypothetical protein